MSTLTRTCESCGEAFTPKWPNRPNRFCSRACYNASGRQRLRAETSGSRMLRRPKHPLAPASGTVAESRLVLYEKIGSGAHPCHWCGTPIRWMPGSGIADGALIADHLDWNIQNNSPENLVPSCHVCNAHRIKGGGREPILPGELFLVATNGTRHRAVERVCPTCGNGFLARLAFVKRGHGRFCSRECAGHGSV